MENLPAALREIRKSKSISQFELEQAAGLCFGTISRIENGKVNPSKETLLKIAQVLNLNEKEILLLFGVDWIVTKD